MANINPETGLGYNNKSGYKHASKLYYRDKKLKLLYNITLLEWDDLLKAQDYKCAICGSTDMRGKNWHTDHCHTTGKIRGILCGWCNTGIGKLQESPIIFEKALNYLTYHKGLN